MKKLILSFLVFAFVTAGFAQDSTKNWKLYPGKADTMLPTDTVYGIKKAYKQGTITTDKDARIDKLSDELRGGATNRPVIQGYRLQILSSSTKSTVDGERARFMTNYRGTKSYIDYKAPNFRLRVGNFRNKLEAQKFQHEILMNFPNTLVISEMIELPRLD
ncbi:MAG: SPOR domain-containing protein [Flavobacteriales bacterium]